MKVYIAGPMRGCTDLNFPLFRAAAEKLRDLGYEVYDPSEHEDPAQAIKPIAEYMQKDLPIVCKVDMLVLLPGWAKSQGASIEHAVASMLGKEVKEYDEF
jgi:hypothetical protein